MPIIYAIDSRTDGFLCQKKARPQHRGLVPCPFLTMCLGSSTCHTVLLPIKGVTRCLPTLFPGLFSLN